MHFVHLDLKLLYLAPLSATNPAAVGFEAIISFADCGWRRKRRSLPVPVFVFLSIREIGCENIAARGEWLVESFPGQTPDRPTDTGTHGKFDGKCSTEINFYDRINHFNRSLIAETELSPSGVETFSLK